MRVLLDTNIYIAFLLSENVLDSVVGRALRFAVERKYSLIVPEEVIHELQERVANKRYLRQRIDQESLDQFESLLRSFGEVLPPLNVTAPKLTRDPKDDYLLAAAVIGDVDILVSGDLDLHAIRPLLPRPAIKTPAEFLSLIESDDTDQV
jgi:putative PIN family toxin of toxin-antitoxin system